MASMQSQKLLPLAIASVFLAACSSSSNSPDVGTSPPTNTNGSTVTGVITAQFDSAKGFIPFPNNLFLNPNGDASLNDTTVNVPVVNPANTADPGVALNALDGFSTNAPWSTTFSTPIRVDSVVAGQTVRFFEVTRQTTGIGVTGFVRELAAGTEFVAVVSPSTEIATGLGAENNGKTGIRLAILPTRALEERKTYMVVITKGIKDAAGNDATPDTTYFLAKRTAPLVVGSCTAGPGFNATSTDPLIPVANACALEPVRQVINSQEAVAASRGINAADIIVSFSATTQSITPVLGAVNGLQTAQPSRLANSGLTTAAAGLPPVADIYVGVTPVNYYLTAPGAVPEGTTGAASPASAVLTGFWRARPNGYIAQAAGLGLSPTSTNLTAVNPFPVRNSVQNIPVLLTVPNAASGRTKPATGWPIVIYHHGITRNRTDALAVSATYAGQGYAVIAIDQPLHGVNSTSPFYIKGTPFGAIANERTFDVDLISNTTGASGPDGRVDDSGAHFINLGSLLTSRDNNRQSQADLLQLIKNIGQMDINADGAADFDATKIAYTGQSLGSINLIPAMALATNVNVGVLSVPGGGIARLLNGSPTFGGRIRAGLAVAAGLQQGTSSFDQYFTVTQTVIDAGDPLNWGRALVATDRVLLHEVVGTLPASDPTCSQLFEASGLPIAGRPVDGCPDAVIPNTVLGAPLSGTEALIATMGLTPITASTQAANGIRGVTRFTKGDHGSLLSPAKNAAATSEMQGQMASFVVSGGAAVVVTNASVVKTN
jgi:hypothetical protein